MKPTTSIVALTPTHLDRVTGGCRLAGGSSVEARAPKPSFGIPVEQVALTDSVPLRDLSSITEHATALASELLSSADLGMVSDIATDAIGEAMTSLPPLWCGPTSGASWGEQGDASAELNDLDARPDDDDDDEDDDDDDDDAIAPDVSTTAPLFLDEDDGVIAPTRGDFDTGSPAFDKLDRGDIVDKFDRGDVALDKFDRGDALDVAGEPGSAWGFVDGPPPPSAPITRGEVAEIEATAPAADAVADANNFFVQGPPPAIAPIRGAAAAAPTSLAFEAAPSSSGHAQIRDHRR